MSTLVRQGRITGRGRCLGCNRRTYLRRYQNTKRAVSERLSGHRGGTVQIGFTDISNAIAAYMTFDFRSDSTPFDAYIRGNGSLSSEAMTGMDLFYGTAGCGNCHSGALFTDMSFHAMGDPQIGPGKAERFESHQRDTGRMKVSNRPEDAYAFRTPSLRNITLTPPYGHSGAIAELAAYLEHHATPVSALAEYSLDEAILPAMEVMKPDLAAGQDQANYEGIAAAVSQEPISLTTAEIKAIIAFLGTLEDPIAKAGGRMPVPLAVLSGLPIDN